MPFRKHFLAAGLMVLAGIVFFWNRRCICYEYD